MRIRAFAIILLASLALGSARAAPQIDPAKEADIRRLMELTGTRDLGVQMTRQMGEQFRQILSPVPAGDPEARQDMERFLDRMVEKLVARARTGELTNLMVPIYDKHLTHEEIKGLIAFYESPLGHKVIQVLPQIMHEAYAAGQQWGQQIGEELALESLQELVREHPELREVLEKRFPQLKQPGPPDR